ncbi:hypothetical protein FQN54_007695 [Arachnomyces sp. PD_36]|nr:hypothetical protein FQN54_007695 [Arachnomyces sp. PD_36]
MEPNNITADDPSPAPPSAATPDPTQRHQSGSSQTVSSPNSVLQDLHSYPFDTDEEFKLGLAVILGHPDVPPTEEELRRNDDFALQARCFYYSRKKAIQPPIDFPTYKAWLQSTQPSSSSISQPSQVAASTPVPTLSSTSTVAETATTSATAADPSQSSTSPTATAEPSYPSSFAHVVELITTGQPIPGIQQIPDTVLTGKEAPSAAAKRRKPWETGDEATSAGGIGTKSTDNGQDIGK